jgi:hypothetical protein
MTRTPLHLNFLAVFLLTGFLLNYRPAQFIGGNEGTVTGFDLFSASIQNGKPDVLRGIYVPDVLALPVVQQPTGQPYYVSTREGETTQFGLATQYGSIGLLAHNTLSGRFFSKIAAGQEVRLVYGAGRVEYFSVTQILRFQALQPDSVTSPFRNMDRDEVISAGEMFTRAYVGDHRLVLQTCIDAYGNSSWGRLFVIAAPKKSGG